MRIRNINGILNVELKHKGQIITFTAMNYNEIFKKVKEIKGGSYAI